MKHVLGIETSCDETAVAVVTDAREIRAQVVLSQLDDHRPYGGVVPEIAARSHIDHLDRLIAQTMTEANLSFPALDGVAVTAGPGLIGGVMVGVMMAKAIASAHRLPFIAVNHLEGHALTVRLTDATPFPYLLLLVSGGHCQLLAVEDVGSYTELGTTLDDAVGESFDKVAKMLGLPYPGGPEVECMARDGDPHRFTFPRPLAKRRDCNFSFSGLKTAVKREVDVLVAGKALNAQAKADLCAAFQYTVGEILSERVGRAMVRYEERCPGARRLVVAGGVAANQYLRGVLTQTADAAEFTMIAPPLALCTDNAAMIAWAGVERLQRGMVDGLDAIPRARWPLAG